MAGEWNDASMVLLTAGGKMWREDAACNKLAELALNDVQVLVENPLPPLLNNKCRLHLFIPLRHMDMTWTTAGVRCTDSWGCAEGGCSQQRVCRAGCQQPTCAQGLPTGWPPPAVW